MAKHTKGAAGCLTMMLVGAMLLALVVGVVLVVRELILLNVL